jgi:hypothetical protein
MMNININAKKHDEMVAHTKTITTDIERLAGYGFITDSSSPYATRPSFHPDRRNPASSILPWPQETPSVSLRRFPIHDDAHGAFMTRSCHTIGVSVNTPSPADLCIQSVMKRDATMGWHQLYSSVHSQVPLSVLVGQVEKQRIAEAGAIVKKRRHRPG